VEELVVIIIRFVDSQKNLQHQIFSFKVLSKSLSEAEFAAFLYNNLSALFQQGQIHFITRDGASVNKLAKVPVEQRGYGAAGTDLVDTLESPWAFRSSLLEGPGPSSHPYRP
jgi:hypothetical protein